MPKEKKDLAIAYRIYPGISKIPPVYSDDKFKLSELCLRSFKQSLGGLRVKIWAILDGCPDEYIGLFKKYFDEDELELVITSAIGNAGTFGRQIDILLEQSDAEFVYFAEDDYFYLPGRFNEMIELMKKNAGIHFVSPYDHPDYYELDIHRHKTDSLPFGKRKWRASSTTCMTFLTTKAVLQQSKAVFQTYTKNNYDASLWLALTKKRLTNPLLFLKFLFTDSEMIRIYLKGWYFCPKQIIFGPKFILRTPQPSIATHMDSKHLAPSIDWYELFG